MYSLNRVAMGPASRKLIKSLGPERLDAVEISGKWGRRMGFRSYETHDFPEYDVCKGPILTDEGKPKKFHVVLANQVWEHLDRPYAAVRNVRRMLKKGGYFWVAVPFYIPFHAAPHDCSRWSARGLKNLLIETGFEENEIQSAQWGNRHVAQRNLEQPWPPEYHRETDDIENDPLMPICSWALARKT